MLDRIQKILQVKKLTPSAFADKIGVPRSTISHVLSGRNNPSLEFVQKILDSFPDIRTQWLVRGDGNMLMHSNTLFPEEDDATFSSLKKETVAYPEPLKETPESVEPPESPEISGQEPVPEQISNSGELKESGGKSEVVAKHDEKPDKNLLSADKKAKKTARVLVFYTDGTFSEYLPSE